MDNATSKNRKKRSSSLAESNNSFVKNVTSTMSNLLPSSITKWFAASSPSNGSTPKAVATDSSSEDDNAETSVVKQPPPKRMRYSSGKLNLLGPTVSKVNYSTGSADTIKPYDIIQSSSSKKHFKKNYVSKSTQTVINEPSSEKRERKTTVIKTPSYSRKWPTVIKKRKSLYDISTNLNKATPKQGDNEKKKIASSITGHCQRQPYYKGSLAASPFYPGKLMYGGAASSYIDLPDIKMSPTTRVNETSNHDNTLSYSTRCVMDLLEHYSSPLAEAKRISPYVNSLHNQSLNKTMDNNPPRSEKTYKTEELQIPNIASILSLKHRSRLMGTTNAARQLIASQSSANYTPYPKNNTQSQPSSNDKLTTKVKNRITRTARGENSALINDLSTPIKLPTATLQIDQNNLPKFNFGSPVGSTPIRTNIKEYTRSVSAEFSQVEKPEEISKDVQSFESIPPNESNSYKFSVPVIISRNLPKPPQAPKFVFEDPVPNLNTIDSSEKMKTSQMSITEHIVNATVDQSKDWKCVDCLVYNKANVSNCVCCSAAKQLNNIGNKCFILTDKSTLTEETGQDKCSKCKEPQKSNGNTWKCTDCWVDNAKTAEKCVCCGLRNPTLSESTEKQPSDTQSDWKCNDCWSKNKHNIDKCVACGGVKPTSASNHTPAISLIAMQNLISSSFNAKDKTFDNILKLQKDKWECTNCLVRNDNDKNKCVCCETQKTGARKEIEATSFHFGANTNTTFKFGIDPKVQVDKSNKDMESEETNNNILAKTPTFTFGLPVNKSDDKDKNTLPIAVNKAIEAPKLNFTFGIPTQTSQTTNQTTRDILEINKEKNYSLSVTEEKVQEVPNFNFISLANPTQNVSKPNSYESNESSKETLPNANSTSASVEPGVVREEKSIAFNPIVVQTTVDMETSKANTFSFAPSGLKFASNLFSAPTSTMANASSSNSSNILPAPITTSSLFEKNDSNIKPMINFFKKVESNPLNTNIFQNIETTTNEITVSTFTTSPKLFSFGSNTQSSGPELNQSKFKFSFGNANKADTPSVFNATFGINKESITSPNPALAIRSLVTGNMITTVNNSMSNASSTTGNLLSVPDLGNNTFNAGNTLKTASTLSTTPSNEIFSGTGQKENMWSNTNNIATNMFVSNATTNSPARPATFTFGSPTPFNANNNSGTTFGNSIFTMQNASPNPSPLFSTPPQPQMAQNIFGNSQTPNSTSSMGTQNIFGNSQTSGSSAPTMGAQNIFGNSQAASSSSPNMSVFGIANPSTNSFNVQNSTIPTFEAPTQNPVPAAGFNFGSQQLGNMVFGFGQDQQPQQQQFPSPVYNFGSTHGTPQFNMGSAPNTTVRRVRKAVRRTQR